MKKILVPTEFTYLSKCALKLGVEIARQAHANMSVVSVIEHHANMFMEDKEQYSHDATSSIKNITQTEEARERMHERAEEVAKMLPEQANLAPKILHGNKIELLVREIIDQQIDLVIMGGDLYDPKDEKSNEILYKADAPVVILKCMISGLDQFRDIILLVDSENDTTDLVYELKDLQDLLDAKIHLLRVHTPKNFLSPKKCDESLESYASHHSLENFVTVSLDAPTELEGLSQYCETIKHAFVALGVHKRGFLTNLITNRNKAEELIANSVHPVWTFKN